MGVKTAYKKDSQGKSPPPVRRGCLKSLLFRQPKMKLLLKAAAGKNMTDLRLHLGKKVAEVPTRQTGSYQRLYFE